jgi:phosphohistidine phosphatase
VDLYLIRHADALALGERGITQDSNRPLSEDGEAQAQALGTALQRRGVRLDKMITSPLLRARQTAEGMLRVWSAQLPEVQVCPALAPDARAKKLARFLRGLNGESVGLVGHQPHLGEWAAWIIGGKKARIDLAKAGVAHITCDEPRKGTGTLVWLVTPEWLGK